ncbi:LuxR C-terminal-related transcriptional regulator [Christensenellaceae bacterium OttesenSCG-928-K19]|nr:LuxR C-terminal-related transcriptional regulator [Christensenellaceae bacterium OttesenSCG-928-K19]
MRKNTRETIIISIFLIFVLAVWLVFFAVPQPAEVNLEKENGAITLTELDFSNTIYYYQDHWENYAGNLYTPQDFESGNTVPPKHMEHADYEQYQYATHRMRMNLIPGTTYAISMKSPDYAMRIFIGNEEFDAIGNPSDSEETNVPRVAERTYYFTPMESTVTVIAQTSNWVHKEGAYSPKFYIGTANNIETHVLHDHMMTFLITGGLLTAFLYHLGLFVLNRRRKPVLIFALCCLLLALMGNKLLPLFSPNYDWFVAFRMEYIVHFLTFAMLALFLDVLFPKLLHKTIMRIYYTLAGMFVILTLVLPTTIISSMLIVFDAVSGGMIVYILIRLGMALRQKKPQNTLAFIGIALVCLFGINDILYSNDIHLFGDYAGLFGNIAGQVFTTPIAMMFFVFCYGLVISLEYAETERKMIEAQQQVKEAEERYLEILAKTNAQLPLSTPDDFGLTGREKDVLWLLLDGKTRPGIAELLFLSMGTVNTYTA